MFVSNTTRRAMPALSPSTLRGVEAFARADAESLPGLDGERDGAETSVARVGGQRVVAEDVLVREVGGDLREGLGEFGVGVRDDDRAAGLSRERFEAALAREVVEVRVVAVARLEGLDLALVGGEAGPH